MAKMRFRASDSRVVFDYPKAEALSDDPDRIIFLSQRNFYLLLNSIEYIGKFRNRVYTGHIDEIYDICSDEQWDTWKGWVEDLENNLGGWPVSNEFLERMAIALESIDEKSAQRVTWEDILSDLATTFGVGSAIYELVAWLGSKIPTIRVKMDWSWMPAAIMEYQFWKAPILGHLTAINVSLAAMAAAAATEQVMGTMRTIMQAVGTVQAILDSMRDAILGDWNLYDDVLKPIWDWFIPDSEGGTGGDDPDNNPDVRIAVNLVVNNPANKDLEPVLDAIENILGGSYEPEG